MVYPEINICRKCCLNNYSSLNKKKFDDMWRTGYIWCKPCMEERKRNGWTKKHLAVWRSIYFECPYELELMVENQDSIKTNWLVYLLECSDGTLYCGATNNLSKRVKAHNDGKGAKYTRGRCPVKVVALRKNLTKSEALRVEYRVKQLPRNKKISYINGEK